MIDRVELSRLPVFASLTSSQRRRLTASATVQHLHEEEPLFAHEERAERFFVLDRGQVKLLRRTANGHPRVIEIINPGEMFGHAALFTPQRTYPVEAAAITSSEVIAFDRGCLIDIVRESSDTALRLLADLSIRLNERLDELEALTTQSSTLRTVNFLLKQVHATEGRRTRITLNAPKKVIASRLSIQPETLSRVLHTLAEQGIIAVEREQIHVLDLDRLRAFSTRKAATAEG